MWVYVKQMKDNNNSVVICRVFTCLLQWMLEEHKDILALLQDTCSFEQHDDDGSVIGEVFLLDVSNWWVAETYGNIYEDAESYREFEL